jgi:hypothetical protein
MTGLAALLWKEYLTLALAILGAALGVMNTWNAMSQSRVRLRVSPAHAIAMPSGAQMFSIEVVNLSSFPVTVADVGFSVDGRKINRGHRLAILQPILIDGKPWPRRLEAREAVSAYFDPSDIVERGEKIGKAYARTSCGAVAYGTSGALNQLRREARG